ncbi:DUF3349 domain-containing protein [Gordonia terrae]|uniref:DUF3349 domain-containing protein n=1 Tax=Gordonia terrae TaxID=2055 RepID=UPI003F6BB943
MVERLQFLKRVVDWLRAGYPNGVPQEDFVPLFALLRRQLSEEEARSVSADLISEQGSRPPPVEPISKIDAAVKITAITQDLPYEADIDRVRRHLEASGWPFDDEPLRPGPPD